jgi:SOS response regulatory protein OraA/RecX
MGKYPLKGKKTTNNVDEYLNALRHRLIKMTPKQKVLEELSTLGFSDEDAIEIVEDLEYEGYLNDKEYISAYLHKKQHNNGYATTLIRENLINQGLPDELITAVFEAESAEKKDAQNSITLAQKYLTCELGNDITDPNWVDAALTRTQAKLARRGYGEDMINAAIREACGKILGQ